MEEIEINGEIYVKKEEAKKEYATKNEDTAVGPFELCAGIPRIDTPDNVSSLAVCRIGQGFVYTKLSLDFLKRALEIMEKVYDYGENTVCLAWGRGYPAVLGQLGEDKKHILGVAIAPRHDDEME